MTAKIKTLSTPCWGLTIRISCILREGIDEEGGGVAGNLCHLANWHFYLGVVHIVCAERGLLRHVGNLRKRDIEQFGT